MDWKGGGNGDFFRGEERGKRRGNMRALLMCVRGGKRGKLTTIPTKCVFKR